MVKRILSAVVVMVLMMGTGTQAFSEVSSYGACSTRDSLRSWSDNLGRLVRPGMKKDEVNVILTYQIQSSKIGDRLTVLCAQWVEGESDVTIQWLKEADRVVQAMVILVFDQVEGGVHVSYDLPMILMRFNEYLNTKRTEAYERSAPQKIEIGAIATKCGEGEVPSACGQAIDQFRKLIENMHAQVELCKNH